MITVYGTSDDLIEVEGDIEEEFSAYNIADESEGDGVFLAFSDGTVLRVMYSNADIWRISPVVKGAAGLLINPAPEDDPDNYSDRAMLEYPERKTITWVVMGSKIGKQNGAR